MLIYHKRYVELDNFKKDIDKIIHMKVSKFVGNDNN